MSWFKFRSHKKVDLSQTMPLPSSDKTSKAKEKWHFSFKNLFKSHKSKESVVADSNKSQVEKKSFFGRKKKTAKPEAFEQNSEIYKSQAPKHRHKHSHKKSNDNPGNNSSLYNSYSGPTVVLPKSSSQPRKDQQSVDYTTELAPQPPINNSAGTKIEQNPQPEAKLANTPDPEPTVSGGVGNVDPGIKPSVDLKTELTEKQAEIQGYQQTIKEYKSLNDSLWIALRESLGEKKQCPTQCREEHGQLMKKIQASYDYIKTLQTNIEVASNGVEAALKGDNKLSTEAQKAYEQIDPKQFGQIKAKIDGINKEIANFKVEVAVAPQQKTLDACMEEENVFRNAFPNYFSRGSSDPEFMKFSNKLAEIRKSIYHLRPDQLNPERFVNNPGGVQTEVNQIKADLAGIRKELKDLDFRMLTNTETEFAKIRENIRKLPRSPERMRYLSAINKGIQDLKNTRAAYEPKDISKWSPMPTDGGLNSINMNFSYEIINITNSVKNAIPEAVREGKEMPSVAKPATPSVSNTKPSAEEIEAARSAFSQTYELYEKLLGTKLEDNEASLEKGYENQMEHLQLMREYVTNNVSVKDGKWDLLKQINGQMQNTKNEYENVHGKFEDNKVVQGYKAVKTAMDNLQQAIDGKGDLKTCQQQMEDAQKKLVETLAQEEGCSVQDVMNAPGFVSGNATKNIQSHMDADVSDLIEGMSVSEDLQAAFKSLDPKNLPQEVEDYNTYVQKEFQDKFSKLKNLKDQVQKELKDGPEKTKFLNDINQGIAKLRELKQDWTAGADALNDLDDMKEEFGSDLNEIMQLTKTGVSNRDRLQALKQAQAPTRTAPKGISQEAWDNFTTQIDNRYNAQVEYLNELRKFATEENVADEGERNDFNREIDEALQNIQDSRNTYLEGPPTVSSKEEFANGKYRKTIEEELDQSVYEASAAVLQLYESMTQEAKNQIVAFAARAQNDFGWDLKVHDDLNSYSREVVDVDSGIQL